MDDCSDGRVKQIIEQWNVSTRNNLRSGGGSRGHVANGSGGSGSASGSTSSLIGFSTGLLGKLSTKILEHVCGLLDVKGLGVVAQIDGRCHRVVESKTLWAALGVSRWELAVRASVKDAAGGFEMVPMLANYRPSSGSSRPTSKDGTRERSLTASSTESATEHTTQPAVHEKGREVPLMSTAPTTGSRTMLGLSMDLFLD